MKKSVEENIGIRKAGPGRLGYYTECGCFRSYVYLDLDWLLFDLEHSGLNEQSAQVLMQGMRGDRVTPLIRVAWNDPVLIKKALDIGAHGVIVPW